MTNNDRPWASDPNARVAGESAATGEVENQPPAFSDADLASRFVRRFADRLRYVAAWNQWFLWDGKRWKHERTLAAWDLARVVCIDAAAERNEGGTQLASAKTINAVVTIARTDRQFAATTEQWDSDPWLLNTPSGVVDLRTGKLREHSRSDYITKITAAGPSGHCERWKRFLNRVTNGNVEMQVYLQKLIGYSLTGTTGEHALYFLYGVGRNGKGVFLQTAAGVMNDYHVAAPSETFTISQSNQHPTELARLRGARLVTSAETERGRFWAESRIKQLTGGDPVSARFMRQDFFDFIPQLKLMISGNHKPSLRSVNEAIRARFNLIPFDVIIPQRERDSNLVESLKEEWPGIMAWAIEGTLMWQKDGLKAPAVVRAATDEYLLSEDAISGWIEACCEKGADKFALSQALFTSWNSYCEQSNERAGSLKEFRNALKELGYHELRNQGKNEWPTGRGFKGLALKANGRTQPAM